MPTPEGNRAKRVQDSTRGPWLDWPKMSRHGRAIRFIETYLRSPKGVGYGKTMVLADFQKEALEEALADGVEAFVMPTPRGNGKSTFGGAVAAWSLFDENEIDYTGSPQVPVVATTVGQAIRSVYGTAASMIQAAPELRSRSIKYTGIATPRIEVPRTEGVLFPISQEIPGLQGLDPSFAIADELGFLSPEVWAALVLAAGKRERSLIWGTGTPGLDRINALWMLREQWQHGDLPPSVIFREYATPEEYDIDDRAGWRIGNPAIDAGFLRESALVTARGAVNAARFQIFRLGRWVEGTTSWLGTGAVAKWQALTDPWDIPPGTPIYCGLDCGIVSDSTALVIIADRGDGKLHARLKLWTPTEEDSVDLDDVRDYLLELAKTYKMGKESIGVDPSYVRSFVLELQNAGLPIVTVPNGAATMAPIVSDLRARIIDGGLTHDDDKVFERHILNARAKEKPAGMVLAKDAARSPIDAAIALSLAVDRFANKPKPRPAFAVV